MYKYKQTTNVEVGDLVIWTEMPTFTTNRVNDKVYMVIGKTTTNNPIIVDETGSEKMYGKAHGFKVLHTKPVDQAVVGDYMYRITFDTSTFPKHSVVKITRTGNERLGYSEELGVDFHEVIVIAQAEQTAHYPVFKEDIDLGFIFKYTGPNEGIYLTNKGIPKRKPGEYLSTMVPEDNVGWKPCDFTIQPDIDDIDWWQARYEAGLPVYATSIFGVSLCQNHPPKEWVSDEAFSMTDPSLAQQAPTIPESAISFALYPSGASSEPTQTTIKEQPMRLQQLLDTIFGVSDYEAKPKFIVTVFSNDKEVATTTANSVEKIQQTIQSDTRLWGCKLVAYKIHSELQTQVPVAITKFKKEVKNAG